MGYSKCAVSGCRSRPGTGILFKYFPKDHVLMKMWLSKLPAGFRVFQSSAICANHFDPSQFERTRADGRKRLKDCAVPSINLGSSDVRIPFRDLSNASSLGLRNDTSRHSSSKVQQDHSYLRRVPVAVPSVTRSVTSTPPRKAEESFTFEGKENYIEESYAAEALLLLSANEIQHTKDLILDDGTNKLKASPEVECNRVLECNSQAIVCNDNGSLQNEALDSTLISVKVTDDQILDEVTGHLKAPPKTTHKSMDEKEVHFVAEWSDGAVILDEVAGVFTLDNKPLQNVPEDIPSTETNEYCTQRDMAVARVMELLKTQEAELNALRKANEEKDDAIAKLKEDLLMQGELKGMFNYKVKYENAKKTLTRLQKQPKENNLVSPWLSDSQVLRLKRKSSRGMKWSSEEIRDGLILKMRCGSSGYSKFVQKYPLLPSIRSLQEAVQFIRFDDKGLLHEVFDLIESMVGGMTIQERDCHMVFDEMAVEQGMRYDVSLKKWVGLSTLPTHTGLASKALVVLLAGVTKRWKVAVAVYFTSKRSEEVKKVKDENLTGKAYGDIVDEVLAKADSVGLNVAGVTSDMGPDNLAFWKSKGVQGGRNTETKPTFPHPTREGAKVHILPIHLQKAIKTMMENNLVITLPPDIVEEEGLPSAVVNYQHVDDLLEFESGCELKVAFRLRQYNIHCKKQFKKMKVSTTKSVLCHRTGVGLKLLANEVNDPSYETTGWFIILLNTFFSLVLCRHRGLAISKSNEEVFQKAIALIKQVEYIFHHMKVGKGNDFKPAQRGMRVLCASLLSLIDYFIIERDYAYLMLGRFTSDCIESLFSCIRLSQPIPHVSAFLQCLKVVTLAQFSEAVKGSSYEFEESSPFGQADFLEEARRKAKERALQRFYTSLAEVFENGIRKLTDRDYLLMNRWERCVLYDMAGSVIKLILSTNLSVCSSCIDAAKWKGEEPHPASTVTEMKEFTLLREDDDSRSLQISVSDFVFQAILTAEISFRLYRERTISFQNADVKAYFVDNLMYLWSNAPIPNCHSLGRKILNAYFDQRLKEFGKIKREKALEETQAKTAIQRSSKSVAMRQVADQITVTGPRSKTNGAVEDPLDSL